MAIIGFGQFYCLLLVRLLYIYIGVGLSALLVSTDWAMLEPLHGGTSDRMALRFFVFVSQTIDINNRTLEP
jgi:hypothetical protein